MSQARSRAPTHPFVRKLEVECLEDLQPRPSLGGQKEKAAGR